MIVNWLVFIPLALAMALFLNRFLEQQFPRLRLLCDEKGRQREHYPDLVRLAARGRTVVRLLPGQPRPRPVPVDQLSA